MENTCCDIVVYAGDQEVVPIVTAAPGHRENAIDVENVPDLPQVYEHFGPIGNPTVRRSRRNRRPTSPAPSTSSSPAKKPKGSGTFPAYFDDDDVPLSRLIPKSGRTLRSAAYPRLPPSHPQKPPNLRPPWKPNLQTLILTLTQWLRIPPLRHLTHP